MSSSTKPDLMIRMLEALEVTDGMQVLETGTGTGTGYNAALLAHRLGSAQVYSVDIDANLVSQARERLSRLGYNPTLVTADGATGLADHALSTGSSLLVPCSPSPTHGSSNSDREPDATGRYTVSEAGPTPLWISIETAWYRWRELGAPAWHDFGLTATLTEHHIWHLDPLDGSRWRLPVSTPGTPA